MSKRNRKERLEKREYEKMTAEELLESLKANHEKLVELRKKNGE